MIGSIQIENLRGIQSGKLENLTPLTVLVGPNGCGKSTILDALLLGVHPVVGDAMSVLLRRRPNTREGLKWLFWLSERSDRIHVEVRTAHRHEGRDYPQDVRGVLIQRNPASGDVSVSVERWDDDGEKNFTEVASISKEGSLGYSRTPFQIDDIESVHLVDAQETTDDIPLHQLYTAAVALGRKKDAHSTLSQVVPGLESVDILTEGNSPVVYLVFSNYAVPVAVAGDGVQSLLRLSLELSAKPNGVVLLEEPEVHEHPGALQQSARAIWAAVRRGIQVILSTHSLDLIDSLLYEASDGAELAKMSVVRIKLAEGCLRSSRKVGEDIAFARTEIGDDLR